MRRPIPSGFRWWLGAATASTLGDAVTGFALAWVAATRGPGVAGLVLTVEGIPLVVLILLGGVVADRWGIRRTMIVCDAVMVLVLVALTVLATRDVPTWALVLVAFLTGTAAAIRRPAGGVFPRLFVRGEPLGRALAMTSLLQQLARMAGPSLGGLLLAHGGLSATSAVDALSFGLILAVLGRVVPPFEQPRSADTSPRVAGQISAAFGVARRTPGMISTLLVVVVLAAGVITLVGVAVPLVGIERGWGAGATGAVASGWLAGGAVVTAVVARRGMPGPMAAVSGPVVAAIAVAVVVVTEGPVPGGISLFGVGVGTSLLTTRLLTRFVEATPTAMLARFQSLIGVAQTGPVLLATPLTTGLVAGFGADAAAAVLAAVVALAAPLAWRAERAMSPA